MNPDSVSVLQMFRILLMDLVSSLQISLPPKMINHVESSTNIDIQIKVYPYRWVQLIIFCLFTVINFMNFLEFSIIANILTKYYNVDSFIVDISSLIFFLVYIVLFLPISYLIERYDLKVTALVSTGLTLAGNVIKVFCDHPSRFYLALIGQTFCALGQVYMLSIPSKFASVWFGAHEVSLACGLAVLGTQLGAALGAIFPTLMVDKNESNELIRNGIFNMTLYYAIANAVIFLLVVLFFKARPKLPPSLSQVQLLTQSEEEKLEFFSTCKTLLKNKDYLLILFSFGLINGMWNMFGVVINTIYTSYFPNGEVDLGIITLVSIILGGCIGSVVWGYVLDKTHQFKKTSFIVLLCALICYALVTCSLILKIRLATFFTIPLFGFFTASTLVISFEYILEVTYPIPESVSCSILNAVIFLFAIIGTLIVEALIDAIDINYGHIFILVIFLICTLTVLLISSNLKRRDANLAAKNNNIVQEES